MTVQNRNDQRQQTELVKQNFPLGALSLFAEIIMSMAIASIVKILSPETSLILILFFRYLFCLPLLILFGFYQRGKNLLIVRQKKILFARSVTGLLGLVLWLLSVIYLNISVATALIQTMPIFITLLAPFMIGEKVGVHRISAIIIGFVGVMILLQPTLTGVNNLSFFPGLIIGLACPFVCALMFIFLRKLGSQDAPISTSIWYNCFGLIIFSLLCIFFNISFPPFNHIWLLLIGCGILASFQQFFLALSHHLASATSLAVVHYTAVPLSILVGIIFFQEKITLVFLIGAIILISANHYIYLREKKLSLNINNKIED